MKKGDPSGVQRCIDAYYRSFVRRFNPPRVADAWLSDMADPDYRKKPRSVPAEQVTVPRIDGGKDGKLIKKMIQTWGEERVCDLCDLFPFIEDRYADQRGYTIASLYDIAQRLILRSNGHGSVGDRSTANRNAVAQATGRLRHG